MALNDSFYSEIFNCEQKWIKLIESGLLNPIYCNLVLKPFYLEKKNELEKEYKPTDDNIISKIYYAISRIIDEIDLYNEQYKRSENSNIKTLIPLFLTSQMNNISQKEKTEKQDGKIQDDINRLQMEKQILENEIRKNNNYDDYYNSDDDYLYDDFPDEQSKKVA